MKSIEAAARFREYYITLRDCWGNPQWWPARSRFEVIAGAYLTQNTAWTNVERALQNLRANRLLTIDGIRRVPRRRLESLIRSAGYFRQKAQRLKTFVRYLDARHGGSLDRMFAQPSLREELLSLNGIGPETADSILLYAGHRPVFVVDAYTRRILERHELLPAKASYEEVRSFCEQALSGTALPDPGEASLAGGAAGACHSPSPMSRAKRTPLAQVYNEMHGLIVGVGKNYCLKAKARCEECPLQRFLPGGNRA